MDEFYRKSRLTGKEYDYFQCVKIANINQAAAYIENDVFPVDVIPAKDKDGRRVLYFY